MDVKCSIPALFVADLIFQHFYFPALFKKTFLLQMLFLKFASPAVLESNKGYKGLQLILFAPEFTL